MTEKAAYQPLPTPHRRAGLAPPSSLQIQQGSLPSELVQQARARHAKAEVLLLPRAAEAYQKDNKPTAAIYLESDLVAVETLRRNGASVDFLDEHPSLVAEFSESLWIDFAVAVAAAFSMEAVKAIAHYLTEQIRRVRQSGRQPALDLILSETDFGTFERFTGSDTEQVLRAYFARAATKTTDSEARRALLDMAAETDPSTARASGTAEIDPTGEVRGSEEFKPPN